MGDSPTLAALRHTRRFIDGVREVVAANLGLEGRLYPVRREDSNLQKPVSGFEEKMPGFLILLQPFGYDRALRCLGERLSWNNVELCCITFIGLHRMNNQEFSPFRSRRL